jgi:hypothetical protein
MRISRVNIYDDRRLSPEAANRKTAKQRQIVRLGIETVEILDAQDAEAYSYEDRLEAKRLLAEGCAEDTIGGIDNGGSPHERP